MQIFPIDKNFLQAVSRCSKPVVYEDSCMPLFWTYLAEWLCWVQVPCLCFISGDEIWNHQCQGKQQFGSSDSQPFKSPREMAAQKNPSQAKGTGLPFIQSLHNLACFKGTKAILNQFLKEKENKSSSGRSTKMGWCISDLVQFVTAWFFRQGCLWGYIFLIAFIILYLSK